MSKIKERLKSKNIDKITRKLLEINMNDTEQELYERYLDSLAREFYPLDTIKAERCREGFKEGFKKGKREQQESTIKIGYKYGLSISLLAIITRLKKEEVILILKKEGLYKNQND